MKYHLITYGCQMNKSDSERIAGSLEKKNYKPASNIDEADLVVVNMCSVRQSAVDRIFGLHKKFLKLKSRNADLKIILTGCILKNDKKNFANIFDSISDKKDFLKNPPQYHDKNIAYISISRGCNSACAYCVVPATRGKLICRDHKEIIREVKNAVEKGSEEIWLLGQNVNDYQLGKINFAKLLKMVNNIPGNFKIRFMSPHPAYFTDELIDTMTKYEKVAHYLNLPVQSGDDKILKAMNRPYTALQYKNLVKKIRKKIPDINLSTDIIVGFPGETRKEFKNTVKLFKELKFNIAYISKYSPRSGTAAFYLKNDVSIQEKKRREKHLKSLLETKKA